MLENLELNYKIQRIKNLHLFSQDLDTWKCYFAKSRDDKSTFSFLCDKCFKDYDIDFNELIDDYSRTSKNYEDKSLYEMKRRNCWKDKNIEMYLRLTLGTDDTSREELLCDYSFKKDYLEALDKVSPALIYCLINGILPFFDVPTGDITKQELNEKALFIYNDIKKYYTPNAFLEGTPFIDSAYNNFKSRLKKNYFGRLSLYAFVYEIMGNIEVNNNTDSYYEASDEIHVINLSSLCHDEEKDVAFIVDDINDEHYGDIYVLERCVAQSYFLYQYKRNKKYMRYEISAFEEYDGSNRQLYVMHAKGVDYIVNHRPIPTAYCHYFYFKTECHDKELTVVLNSIDGKKWHDFPKKLKMTKYSDLFIEDDDKFANIYKKKRKKDYMLELDNDKYLYTIEMLEHVRTDNYLFVKRSTCESKNGMGFVNSYYRIPVSWGLYDGEDYIMDESKGLNLSLGSVEHEDIFKLYTYDNKKYLFSNNTLWSAEVTTPEDCIRNSISIVPFITQLSLPKNKYIPYINKVEKAEGTNAGELIYNTYLKIDTFKKPLVEDVCKDKEKENKKKKEAEVNADTSVGYVNKEVFTFTDQEGNGVDFLALTNDNERKDVKLKISYTSDFEEIK